MFEETERDESNPNDADMGMAPMYAPRTRITQSSGEGRDRVLAGYSPARDDLSFDYNMSDVHQFESDQSSQSENSDAPLVSRKRKAPAPTANRSSKYFVCEPASKETKSAWIHERKDLHFSREQLQSEQPAKKQKKAAPKKRAAPKAKAKAAPLFSFGDHDDDDGGIADNVASIAASIASGMYDREEEKENSPSGFSRPAPGFSFPGPASSPPGELGESTFEPEEFGPPKSHKLLQQNEEPAFCYLCAYGDPDAETGGAGSNGDVSFESMSSSSSGGAAAGFQSMAHTDLACIGEEEGKVAFVEVLKIVKRNRGKWPLATQVGVLDTYYREHVQPILTDYKSEVTGNLLPNPDWPPEVIWAHLCGLAGHRRTNNSCRSYKIDVMDEMLSCIVSNKVFFKDKSDPSGQRQDVSMDGVKAFIAVSKHQEQVMLADDRSRKLCGGKV